MDALRLRMLESILKELDRLFPSKALLTLDDICTFLECDRKTIYNWTKRAAKERQTPRIVIGRTLRFPKKEFVNWLSQEQMRGPKNISFSQNIPIEIINQDSSFSVREILDLFYTDPNSYLQSLTGNLKQKDELEKIFFQN